MGKLAFIFVIFSVLTLKGQHTADSSGSLYITWMGVIDNEEQPGGFHGPLGNFHILVYPADTVCPGMSEKFPQPVRSFVIRGPDKREWDDGSEMSMKVEIYKWRNEDDKVQIFIYESDPSFWIFRRKHDPVFCDIISRRGTQAPVIFRSRYVSGKRPFKRAIKRGAMRWLKEKNLERGTGFSNELISFSKTFIEFHTE